MAARHPPPTRPALPAWIAASVSTQAGPRSQPSVSLAKASTHIPAPTGVGLDSLAVRQRMVQRLVAEGIHSPTVLAAMSQVERHRFVDSALASQAYEDTSLPIGLQQTISKPSVVARMIELLLQAPGLQNKPRPDRILEIGTGCGYQAAVLAHIAREVYSIERLFGLHEKACRNLRPLQIHNLHLIFGDGMQGHMPAAPYDAIISAAGGESMPTAWLEQLAPGGRIVAPVVRENTQQALLVLDKNFDGSLHETLLEAVHFVPLKSGTS